MEAPPLIINDGAELVRVDTLVEHPENPRRGDLEAVVESIEANDFFGRLVVQRSTRHVLAGNHRLRAARELGMPEVPVEWVDVDDERALRILLADNRTSDLGTYDGEALTALLEDLAASELGLAGTGYDGDALDDLLRTQTDAGDAWSAPVDRTDELDGLAEKWGTAVGQVWEIPSVAGDGAHRIACGDSTDRDVVASVMGDDRAALVNTDPPYNVAYESDVLGSIENDEMADDEFEALVQGALAAALAHATPDAALYVWHASVTASTVERAMNQAGAEVRQQVVWVKESFALGRSDYQWQHELCFYAGRTGAGRPFFTADRSQRTVWSVTADTPAPGEGLEIGAGFVLRTPDGRAVTVVPGEAPGLPVLELSDEGAEVSLVSAVGSADGDVPTTAWRIARDKGTDYLHPTQKPAALAERAVLNSTRAGDVVLDVFAGGGGVLEACERTWRTARMVDLDPRFVAVVLERAERLGLSPVLRQPGEIAAGETAAGETPRDESTSDEG